MLTSISKLFPRWSRLRPGRCETIYAPSELLHDPSVTYELQCLHTHYIHDNYIQTIIRDEPITLRLRLYTINGPVRFFPQLSGILSKFGVAGESSGLCSICATPRGNTQELAKLPRSTRKSLPAKRPRTDVGGGGLLQARARPRHARPARQGALRHPLHALVPCGADIPIFSIHSNEYIMILGYPPEAIIL